ncbi:MAG: hypothetical protein KY476_16830 [Planctomycetes bacterium]|nr:hypothetical protein [Planctomycetota bacterium]
MNSHQIRTAAVAILLLSGSAIVSGGLVNGGDKKEQRRAKSPAGKFVAPGQVLNVVKTVPALSGDGVVVTHIFEDFSVEIGGRRASPEADSLSATVRSTLAAHDKPVHIRQILEGHVDVQPGVEAVVLLQSCGKTTLVPLPKNGKEFRAEVVGAVESGPDYLATICILLQRASRDHEVSGLLVVDSLELTIVEAPEARK